MMASGNLYDGEQYQDEGSGYQDDRLAQTLLAGKQNLLATNKT